jgi:hypothetical protein
MIVYIFCLINHVQGKIKYKNVYLTLIYITVKRKIFATTIQNNFFFKNYFKSFKKATYPPINEKKLYSHYKNNYG